MRFRCSERALTRRLLRRFLIGCAFAAFAAYFAAPPRTGEHNVRAYGARGDGTSLDTAAIQRAIDAAFSAGGGTVILPAGDYLSFSLRLRSRVGLRFEHGAILRAATPGKHAGSYDAPEPNPWDAYQDFGHSHWRNSLIWGESVEHVSISGPGRILGDGLVRRGPGPRRAERPGDTPGTLKDAADASRAVDPEGRGLARGNGTAWSDEFDGMVGEGNKAIALKLSRHVAVRDLTIVNGGHFAVLATGVDRLVIENVKVDTMRDGFDIDSCRHVRISNCVINTPNDDAIVLKSSFALGYARATEHVSIAGCRVSGFDPGTLLDGTRGRTQKLAPDRDGPTGRIKLGTESNGGFRDVSINNCVFERSRGIALETVDGGPLENVRISDIVMRDVTTAPIFLRVGARMRGPEGARVSGMRGILLTNITAYNAEPRYSSIIAGLPDHPINGVELSGIRVVSAGGGTREQAARVLAENEQGYPEPSMFGVTPSHGLYIRHARGFVVRNASFRTLEPDARPAVVVERADGVLFDGASGARRPGQGADFVAKSVRGLVVRNRPGHPDRKVTNAEREEF
ncbi:family 28 glycoside hydrolase [Hyaloraphidium curvatum]|nr:family 28 glycoside hydrolase [Hyaloraphidium curvatum]